VRQGLFDGNVVDAHLAQRLFGYPAITQVYVDPTAEALIACGARLPHGNGSLAPILEVELDDGDRCHGLVRNGGRLMDRNF
jgi:hypothetical protein